MSQDFSIKQSKWNTKAANKRPKSLIKYFFLPMTGVDPMTVSRQKNKQYIINCVNNSPICK